MSVEATVETEYGERLIPWHADGTPGGQSVESFLNILMSYCSGGDNLLDEVNRWFAKLESVSGQSICELTEPLRTGFYYGSWEYTDDEYERFLTQAQEMPLSEAEFKETLRRVARTWVPAEQIFSILTTLLELLPKTDVEATWWYDPKLTIADFLALKDVVEIAARGPRTRIRIQFL